MLLGNGVNFSTSHRKMHANQAGKWISIVLGWGIAVFLGAYAAKAIGAPGHLNPAVSIYYSFIDYKALAYIPFQIIGAMLGQTLLYIMNWNFIKEEIENGDKTLTRGASCTNPVFDGKKGYFTNFLYEFVGLSIILMVLFIFEKGHIQEPDLTVGTIAIVSLTVMGVVVSLGSVTGAALNPARDLGPRIVYQIFRLTKPGKVLVDANWQYSWIPVFAPILAGIFFGLLTLA